MYIAAILFLMVSVWVDKSILKHHHLKVFHNTFCFSKMFVGLYGILSASLLFFDRGQTEAIGLFILLSVFPIYILRRNVFLKEVREDQRLQYAANGMAVILYWIFGVIAFSMFVDVLSTYELLQWEELEEMVISAGFSSALLIFLIQGKSKMFQLGGFWENVGFLKQASSFWRTTFFPALCGLGMAYFAATVITERAFQPETPLSEILNQTESVGALVGFTFLALVVAPLVEEITFRGYFFEILKRVKGQRVAFYVIALTFGALHMAQYWGDWAAITTIMIMGFVLTFVRVFAQTTAASVCTHYFYNIGVVVFASMMQPVVGMTG